MFHHKITDIYIHIYVTNICTSLLNVTNFLINFEANLYLMSLIVSYHQDIFSSIEELFPLVYSQQYLLRKKLSPHFVLEILSVLSYRQQLPLQLHLLQSEISINQSISQSFCLLVSQSVSHPISQSVHQPASQLVKSSQPVSQPVSQWLVNQSLNQLINPLVNQLINGNQSSYMYQSICQFQTIEQSFKELVNQFVCSRWLHFP